MRLLASLGHYVATRDASGLQIHQYAAADACRRAGRSAAHGDRLSLGRARPAHGRGDERDAVDAGPARAGLVHGRERARQRPSAAADTAAPRLPAARARVGARRRRRARPADAGALRGSAPVDRVHARLRGRSSGARSSTASSRPTIRSARLADLEIDTGAPLTSAWDADRLDGVAVVRAHGWEVDTSAWRHRLYRPLGSAPPAPRRPVALTAIPYYAWANREPGAMRVWIPRAEDRA